MSDAQRSATPSCLCSPLLPSLLPSLPKPNKAEPFALLPAACLVEISTAMASQTRLRLQLPPVEVCVDARMFAMGPICATGRSAGVAFSSGGGCTRDRGWVDCVQPAH
jgi:hypothetical protein